MLPACDNQVGSTCCKSGTHELLCPSMYSHVEASGHNIKVAATLSGTIIITFALIWPVATPRVAWLRCAARRVESSQQDVSGNLAMLLTAAIPPRRREDASFWWPDCSRVDQKYSRYRSYFKVKTAHGPTGFVSTLVPRHTHVVFAQSQRQPSVDPTRVT
jgi:hypothetical protein